MTILNQQFFSVLLVDDDQDDQFFFREALTHLDTHIKLSVASSHYEAITYLNAHIPHFIFLDINMPIVNGKDTLKYIRSNKKYDGVHVIMLTTSSNQHDIDDCYKLGANLYVSKPLSQSEHTTILQRIFLLYSENKLEKPTREKFLYEWNRRSGDH